MNDSDLCRHCGHKRSEHSDEGAVADGKRCLTCPNAFGWVYADHFDAVQPESGYYTHIDAMRAQKACEPEPGHPEFLKLLDQMRELHQRKAADYGTRGEDPLANLRASEGFGIPAWVGAVIRCNDKMRRVMAFVKHGELKNESVEDSLLDGAAYFLLGLVLFREQKKGA